MHRAVELEAELHQKAKRCAFLLEMSDSLTPQEAKVAVLVAQGNSNRDIASILGVGERMVEVHRSRAYEKLGVDKPAELATTIADMKACGITVGSRVSNTVHQTEKHIDFSEGSDSR